MNPQEYNFQHTKERCMERYNIDLTRLDYMVLCNQIKNGVDREIIDTTKQGNGTQLICKVNLYDQVLYVVYLDETGLITTALPKEPFTF